MPEATLKITGKTSISVMERTRALQYINDNLDDVQIARLLELAQSKKAREMLSNNFKMLKMFI